MYKSVKHTLTSAVRQPWRPPSAHSPSWLWWHPQTLLSSPACFRPQHGAAVSVWPRPQSSPSRPCLFSVWPRPPEARRRPASWPPAAWPARLADTPPDHWDVDGVDSAAVGSAKMWGQVAATDGHEDDHGPACRDSRGSSGADPGNDIGPDTVPPTKTTTTTNTKPQQLLILKDNHGQTCINSHESSGEDPGSDIVTDTAPPTTTTTSLLLEVHRIQKVQTRLHQDLNQIHRLWVRPDLDTNRTCKLWIQPNTDPYAVPICSALSFKIITASKFQMQELSNRDSYVDSDFKNACWLFWLFLNVVLTWKLLITVMCAHCPSAFALHAIWKLY